MIKSMNVIQQKRKNFLFSKNTGFSLIEIVLGIGMLTVSLVSITSYYKKVLDVSTDTTRHIQSGFLLEEGLESVKMLRAQGFTSMIAALSTTTTYYLYWSGTQWTSTTTPQMVENYFVRSFRLSDINRNDIAGPTKDDIVSTGGVYDPGTKKVTMSVVWTRKGTKSMATDTAETYITNLFNN